MLIPPPYTQFSTHGVGEKERGTFRKVELHVISVPSSAAAVPFTNTRVAAVQEGTRTLECRIVSLKDTSRRDRSGNKGLLHLVSLNARL
ncbi:hypothetical protein AGOR_G00183090 [Albula goreensis]|uniref:Uncharacterized protein n=1 Tax=Albula goreensis TaxID=1534307 RepID=A0A8T3CWY8_9TELE|nr:hypothetical protein AGOR_G00183090 [Albula goreensis]